MTKAHDLEHGPSSRQFNIAMDGAGYIAPLSEGYRRKGGQNPEPSANNPRPPAPEPFRPAPPSQSAPANSKVK